MSRVWLLIPSMMTAACASVGDPDQDPGDNEVITTVVLTFASKANGTESTFQWADPENDGSPVIDPITLADADDYDLSVQFLNELEIEPEDITVEVAAEDDQHQLFFTGSAVQGPATGDNPAAVVTHAYSDTDENGYPVGLANAITTLGPGSGTFEVVLRHLPPENDVPVKSADLAEQAAASGLSSLPGDTDVQVSFDLTVQ